MAPILASILNKQTPFRFVNGSDGESLMELELVEGIVHNLRTSLTSKPADAETVNDNIKNEPISITMVCRISNNPVSLVSNLQGVVSSILPPNPIAQQFFGKGIIGVSTLESNPFAQQSFKKAVIGLSNEFLENSTNRRQDFFDKLVTMRKNRIPFDVITGLKVYQNMFFKTLTVKEDKTSTKSLIFTCVLEEIDLKALIKEFNSNKKKNLGLKKTEEVPLVSILQKLANKFVTSP